MNCARLGHVKITPGDIEAFLSRVESVIESGARSFCISLNLTKYVLSKDDLKLRDVINSAALVNADGASVYWLARRAGLKGVRRVTGIELAERLLRSSRERGWRVFLFGAKPEVLDRAVENMKKDLGDPIVVGRRHGYFKDADVPGIIDEINRSEADILLLGLGVPQKEYFVADHFDKLKVRLCLPVGGAFDVWAGAKQRAPRAIQRAGLEWLYRSFYDRSRAGLVARHGLYFLKDFIFYNKKQGGGRAIKP
jgi:N-acetylglucosaminyldiphosphoundecaprenol N-acetyl-beta-D-mannosaminyltransferase